MGNAEKTPDIKNPSSSNGVGNLESFVSQIKNIDLNNASQNSLTDSLKSIFSCESATLLNYDESQKELYSRNYRSNTAEKIRFDVSPNNLAGFVAATRKPVNISDVHSKEELAKHHNDLTYDDSWDDKNDFKARSIILIPLPHKNKLVGVMEIVNKTDGTPFLDTDFIRAKAIALVMGLALVKLKERGDGNEIAGDQINTPDEEQKPTKFSYLIANGFLTDDELTLINKKSQESGKDVEDLLIKEHFLRPLDVGKSLEAFYYIPYEGYDESTLKPDLENYKVNVATLHDQHWVPLKNSAPGMVILLNDPTDNDLIESIKQTFPNKKIEFRVGLKKDIKEYITGFYKVEESQNISETEILAEDKILELAIKEEEKTRTPEDQVVIPDSSNKVFDEMLSNAVKQGVTDIHIEPGMEGKNLLIRLRKEGACRVYEEVPSNMQKDIINHIKTLAGLDRSVNQLPQNGKFVWSLDADKYDLSVVVFPTIGNLEDAMIRVSQIGKPVPRFIPITQMEFSDPNLDKIMSRIHASKGMVLVTGPEGTGKTTTLHAFLGHLNTPEKKIVTAESPVDIVQNGLRQIQTNQEIGLNYSFALETFLLGNPDIIMIGEVADTATLKLCNEAAKERLVFSSLQAKSTMDAIRIMREMNIDSNQFAETFLLIMAQKLVPSLCSACKEDYRPSQEEFDMLEKFYGSDNFSDLGFQYNDNLTLKKAVGCKQCIFTGYSGKIVLQEVLERTHELNRLIAEKAPLEEIQSQALKDGMITLNQDGIYKIMNGDCDFKKVQEAFLPGRI
jgi:type II secretory ATPase GspE/PulE/Tfp pilus assembly ATPase PilB-like protein